MIATSIPYDLVFLIHIIAAVDTLIVFIVMRTSAQAIAKGAAESVQRKRFPDRRNWRYAWCTSCRSRTDHVLDRR